MKKKKKLLFLMAGIIITTTLVYFFDIPQYLTLEVVKQHRDTLLNFSRYHSLLAVFLYCLIYIASVILLLPGAATLSLVGGFLFGTIYAAFLIIGSATLGGLISFLIIRYLIGTPFQQRYKHKIEIFNKELEKSGFFYLLSLRLIPIFPFFLVNVLAALTTVSPLTFFLTTALGILPGAFIFAFTGNQLHTIKSVSDVFSPAMLIAFTLLGLLILLPAIYKKTLKNDFNRTK